MAPIIICGEAFGIGSRGQVQSTLTLSSSSSSSSAAAAATTAWEDPDFPASNVSIEGKSPPVAKIVVPSDGGPPQCRCGVEAKRSLVEKKNHNHGRAFFACHKGYVEGRCKFFAWADAAEKARASQQRSRSFVWRRFPDDVLVRDEGFRAADLRQGGLGDCWFLSALAVVAERHDLIARLFVQLDVTEDRHGSSESSVAAPGGKCAVRLFLDGAWRVIEVDDRLPCVASGGAPRRAELATAHRLAFSRAAKGQLWVQLLEKAYAKAHGSYKAISGGEIAEALLALTGAPSHTIDFTDHDFDMALLWSRLCYFAKQGFPMGCATPPNDQLRQVGLVGNHAYSILDCRTVERRWSSDGREGGPVHLIRVRNPHGQGEWSGDWGDSSAKWSELVAASDSQDSEPAPLERTGENDGTWWIDLTHFVMAFALVEVSLAHREGWHSGSLPNAFGSKTSLTRLCRSLYRIRVLPTREEDGASEAESEEESVRPPCVLFATALQPAARGSSRGRSDRKKSYKLGDLTIVVVRLERRRAAGSSASASASSSRKFDYGRGNGDGDGDVIGDAAGMQLCVGAANQKSCAVAIDSAHEYVLCVFNLGAPPSAAASRKDQPFVVRLCSSQPLSVDFEDATRGRVASLALRALHRALRSRRVESARAAAMLQGSLLLELRLPALVIRSAHRIGPFATVVVQSPHSGMLVLLAVNDGRGVSFDGRSGDRGNALLEVTAQVKVMNARGPDGTLLKPHAERTAAANAAAAVAAAAAAAAPAPRQRQRRPQGQPRWPAKWKVFLCRAAIPLGSQRIVLCLIGNGRQARVGTFECRCVAADEADEEEEEEEVAGDAQRPVKRAKGNSGAMAAWLGASSASGSGSASASASASSAASTSSLSLFSPRPIAESLPPIATQSSSSVRAAGGNVDDALLEATLAASRAAAREKEKREREESEMLARAIALSAADAVEAKGRIRRKPISIAARVGADRRIVYNRSPQDTSFGNDESFEDWLAATRPSLVSPSICEWLQVINRTREPQLGMFIPAAYQDALDALADYKAIHTNCATEKKRCVASILESARVAGFTTGKWMIFLSRDVADANWIKIATAVVEGELGCAAKIGPTKIDTTHQAGAGRPVLCCIYTSDFSDRAEVKRVLLALDAMGLPGGQIRCGYKPDVFTSLGIKAGNQWSLPTTIYAPSVVRSSTPLSEW